MGDFDQHKHCREEEEEKEEEEGEGEVPPPRALSFCEWCSVLQILLSFWTCISASGPNERKVSLLSLILVNMQLPMASASGDYSYSHDYSYDDGRAFGAGGGSKRVGGGRDGRSSLALSPAAGRGKFGDSTTTSRTRITDGGMFLSGAAADPKGGPDGAGASLGRIFQDSDWLRDGPMRRIGPPWGIFGQESLQIPPAERSPGSTLGLGPLLDIQTFGGRRRRQFEPRYARVEPPPAPTASGPISNIGPRPRADPRTSQ